MIPVKQFQKGVDHLTQEQVLTGGVSAIIELLVAKNIVTYDELQNCFTEWMKKHGLEKQNP